MRQHLQALSTELSKPMFSKKPIHEVTKYAWTQNPLNVQNRPVGYNVTEYEEFTDRTLYSI